MKRIFTSVAAISLAFAISAPAITISTGVDAFGNLLAPNALETLYTAGGIATSASVGTGNPGAWVPNTAMAQWIVPNTQNLGISTYTMAVIGAGSISGRFTSDNPGALFVNGTLITSNPGWANSTDQGTYRSWYNFSAPLPNAGANTIEWRVNNLGGPAGLIVEGTATLSAVPDGSTSIALLGMAFTGLGMLRRKL